MSLLIERALTPASCALQTAGRDIVRGASLLGRGTIGLAGISTLLVGLALLGSGEVRERMIRSALSVAGVASGDRAIDEQMSVRDLAPATRWSDWLTATPAAADPAQERVTRYLSRRYKVAENAVRQIVGEAFSTGRSLGVDPLLVLAVTAVESSLNPFAQSPLGAQGLMQIMTRVHSDKFADHGGDHAALDPIANLKVGTAILGELIRRGGSVERGLQLYVGAGNLPDDGGYATRVLAELARIRTAAGGEVLAAKWRADDAREARPAARQPVSTDGPAAASPAGRNAT
jgi:hypothetical protein